MTYRSRIAHIFDIIKLSLCLADLVAYATLRQMEPASPQDPEWTQESSLQQAVRTVTKLHAASIQTEGENDPNVKLFAAPTVAYFFSLLRAVLMGRVKSEEAAAMCLRIIHHHAMSRNAAGSQDLDEVSTAYRSIMFE